MADHLGYDQWWDDEKNCWVDTDDLHRLAKRDEWVQPSVIPEPALYAQVLARAEEVAVRTGLRQTLHYGPVYGWTFKAVDVQAGDLRGAERC